MINCIVIDDEPPAIGILEAYISRIDYLHLVKTFTDPLQALQHLTTEKVDLAFIDINMPQLKGVDLVKNLRGHTMVVFTTAYPDYAVEGFALNVLDYLVKPISFERFLQTAQRAFEEQKEPAAANEPSSDNDFLFIKSGTKVHKVYLKDILFIEGLKEYVSIKTAQQKIVTLNRMSEIEATLKEKGFIRIHKSCIINMDKIDSIEFNHVKIGSESLPIGEKYKEAFENTIRRKML
jgi:two-component system, LytTR family, response regulator